MRAAEGAGIEASAKEGYMDRTIPRRLWLNARENETGREDMVIWEDPRHRTKNPGDLRIVMDPPGRYYPQHRTWRATRLRLSPTPA